MNEDQTAGTMQIDVNLVIKGYKDMVANQVEQIVIQSAQIGTLNNSVSELTSALQQAHAALLQAQEDQETSKAKIEALKNPEIATNP